MNKYMILLFDDMEAYADMTPELFQEEVALHAKWIEELGEHYDSGEALEEGAKSIKGKEKVVSDGPYIEAKELIGGFYIINASSLEEATELAKGCPTLRLGGGLEVRPVMKMEY